MELLANHCERMKRITAEELLAADHPLRYASAANGTDEGFDGHCPCCLIHGEGFEVNVSCWRGNDGCSSIEVSGSLGHDKLQEIAAHIRDNNGWSGTTDWEIKCGGPPPVATPQ